MDSLSLSRSSWIHARCEENAWDNEKWNKEELLGNHASFTTSCRLQDSAAGKTICLSQVLQEAAGGDFILGYNPLVLIIDGVQTH